MKDVIYPKSEREAGGLAELLIVFGNRFTIEVRRRRQPPPAAGSRIVPGRCAMRRAMPRPATRRARAEATWTLQVGAADRAAAQYSHVNLR